MQTRAQFVGWVLAMGTSLTLGAQISDPNAMVSGPPRPPAIRQHTHTLNPARLQWLWQYTQPEPNGNAVTLRADPRFADLLSAAFPQSQSMMGRKVPLATAIPRFLDRYGEVNSRDNRYVTVDGCVPSFCAAHGLLWVDLGAPDPLLVFAAVDWTTAGHTTEEAAADYNLWLFPSRQLSADALPFALTEAISRWDARLASAHRGVPHIAHALLVEPSGEALPLNPRAAGANTLPAQPDMATPRTDEP